MPIIPKTTSIIISTLIFEFIFLKLILLGLSKKVITLNIKTVNSKIVQNNNTPNFSMKGTKKNVEDQKTLERKVKYKPLDIFSDLLLFVFSIKKMAIKINKQAKILNTDIFS